MTTHLLIHRAVVHAGAAADAAQHLLEVAADQPRAPTVDQHHIHMLGTVLIAHAARPGQHGKIVRRRLASCRARQKTHGRRQIFQRGQHFLDAGHRHMDARHHRAHALVALVRNQHHRTRFRHHEVAAGHAHVGGHEVRTQHLARFAGHVGDLGQTRPVVRFREKVGDLVLILMDDRRDDVARRLVVVDLQNVFAQIGFDRLHAHLPEYFVQAHFLGDHRLGLDHLLHFMPARNIADEARGLLRRLGEQDRDAAPGCFTFERLEPDVEIVQRTIAALLQRGASGGKIDRGHGLGAGRHELGRQLGQVLLQTLVGELLARAGLEMHRLDLHGGLGRIGVRCASEIRE